MEGGGELVGVVESDIAQSLAQEQALQHSDRRPPSERRVGARPGVTDGDYTGGHRLPFNCERADPVLELGHDEHALIERLTIKPVGNERQGSDESVPPADVAQAVQLLVLSAGHQYHAPGAVVGGERQARDGPQ